MRVSSINTLMAASFSRVFPFVVGSKSRSWTTHTTISTDANERANANELGTMTTKKILYRTRVRYGRNIARLSNSTEGGRNELQRRSIKNFFVEIACAKKVATFIWTFFSLSLSLTVKSMENFFPNPFISINRFLFVCYVRSPQRPKGDWGKTATKNRQVLPKKITTKGQRVSCWPRRSWLTGDASNDGSLWNEMSRCLL